MSDAPSLPQETETPAWPFPTNVARSWNGFNVCGDDVSIKEVGRLAHCEERMKWFEAEVLELRAKAPPRVTEAPSPTFDFEDIPACPYCGAMAGACPEYPNCPNGPTKGESDDNQSQSRDRAEAHASHDRSSAQRRQHPAHGEAERDRGRNLGVRPQRTDAAGARDDDRGNGERGVEAPSLGAGTEATAQPAVPLREALLLVLNDREWMSLQEDKAQLRERILDIIAATGALGESS